MVLLALSGCAVFRSYNDELNRTLARAAMGDVDAAIRTLERANGSDDKDLLYYLELGELQRLEARYAASQSAWLAADQQVQGWEAAARADPARIGGAALSYLLNDKVRPYEGHDYEKVMLTTRMAMNHLARGEWDQARVAIKRTHEREAVIAAVRAEQLDKIEAEARKRGVTTSFKELNGYPVQTIDNPEVNALRNSYQSAFSHYLAAFVYEALGEPSLAAAGYRQAIELRPGVALLEDALAQLDQRVAASDGADTDVLIVVETGFAPARVSRHFNLPIPINRRWVLVPVSYPVMVGTGDSLSAPALRLDSAGALPVATVTSIDAMARRALADEMPGLTLRAFVRSTAKVTAQYQVQRAAERRRRKGDDAEAAALDMTAIALAIGAAVTESADERTWRSLPGTIHVARARIPRGRHALEIETGSGTQRIELEVDGRYAVVALRLVRGRLFPLLPQAPLASAGAAAAPAAAPEAAPTLSETADGSDSEPQYHQEEHRP